MNKFPCTDDFITHAVNEYSDTIYRVALNVTRNPQDAYDVCQDVFVRLMKNTDKIKNEEHLKAWLIRAAVNCAKSSVTSAFRRHNTSLEDIGENSIVYTPEEKQVLECVSMLPQKYRVTIHLHYYEDMKISEIAKALSISESAVKSRLRRGRNKLKELLENE